MNPLFSRATAGHDRAQELAAIRLDQPLEAPDGAWLDAHLRACADCAAVAEAFTADQDLFGGLRHAAPVPPRDLWARTAAAIDAEAGGRRAWVGRRIFGVPALTLAPVAGFAAVAILVGSAFLNGSPVVPQPADPSGPPPMLIALAPGDVKVLSRGADGTYQVQTGVVDEVCPLAAEVCEARPSFEATQLATIGGADSVGAIISPAKDRLVVVQRGATGADGVYVVPVRNAGTAMATARPTGQPATAAPATTAPATTAPATTAPATTAPSTSVPSDGPAGSGDPDPSSATLSPAPTATADVPIATTEPSGTPGSDPSSEPQATPKATPQPTPEPTAAVAVTPAPDGGDAIQIAKDVVVVGGIAAYSADGSHFAFTARPADGSVGPDVFVWNTSEPIAHAVTTDHRSIFAGWEGKDLLVSRMVDGTPRTFRTSARTGAVKDEVGQTAWLPTVAPDGDHAAWWDGTVALGDDGLTWDSGKGRLVLGGWPGTAGDAQVLAKGSLAAWEVRWDAKGTVIGVWTSADGGAKSGRLSLYPVDRETGRARLGAPILDDVPALAGFSIEDGQLIYPGPGSDGARSLWVVAWKGDTVVGRVELASEGGATVIR